MPKFIAINGQATNDSFSILLSTICLYSIWRFYRSGNTVWFAAMTVSAIMAGLTKGNSLALFPIVAAMFLGEYCL